MPADHIDLERLKAVVERLLDGAIKRNGSKDFKLDHNFYWELDFEDQFNVSSKPAAPESVGSLVDDWEMTRDIAEWPSEQEVAVFSLTEIAPLLLYIGHQSIGRTQDS